MNAAGMVTLAEFTYEQLCVPQLHGRDAAMMLFELSRAMEAAGAVPGAMSLFNAALNQYYLTSDDQTRDVAYPVGCVPSLAASVFAVGVSDHECCWRTNTQPVYVMFLIATTTRDAAISAAIVHAIKRAALDRAVMRLLHSGSTATALRAALATIPLDGSRGMTPPIHSASACTGAFADSPRARAPQLRDSMSGAQGFGG